MPDYFTPRQLSQLFHVGLKTIYRWLQRGELPGVLIGGRWYTSRADLHERLKAPRLSREAQITLAQVTPLRVRR